MKNPRPTNDNAAKGRHGHWENGDGVVVEEVEITASFAETYFLQETDSGAEIFSEPESFMYSPETGYSRPPRFSSAGRETGEIPGVFFVILRHLISRRTVGN